MYTPFFITKEILIPNGLAHANPLYEPLESLLKEITREEIEKFLTVPEVDEDNEDDETIVVDFNDFESDQIHAKISVEIALNPSTESQYGGDMFEVDFSEIISRYYLNHQVILDNIKARLSPLDPELSEKFGFDLEKYSFEFFKLNCGLKVFNHRVRIRSGKTFDETGLRMRVVVDVYFRVEDISKLVPGEIQALELKYHNLKNNFDIQELKQWANEIGVEKVEEKSREELAEAIKQYYQF